MGTTSPNSTAYGVPLTVYLIRDSGYDSGRGAFKIGYTDAGLAGVAHRLRMLQTGNPSELQIVRVLVGAPPTVEAGLQEQFADEHISGEWFKAQDAIISSFDQLAPSWPIDTAAEEREPLDSLLAAPAADSLPSSFSNLRKHALTQSESRRPLLLKLAAVEKQWLLGTAIEDLTIPKGIGPAFLRRNGPHMSRDFLEVLVVREEKKQIANLLAGSDDHKALAGQILQELAGNDHSVDASYYAARDEVLAAAGTSPVRRDQL